MLVASVDYPNKRIYLSVATINTNLDTLDIYKEVRGLRLTNQTHRNFKPMIVAGGNLTKITGVSSTPAYVQLLYGCRIIPYDTPHTLKVIRDTFTDNGFAGRDCFDRTSVVSAVDIDVDFPEIEIKVMAGGSGSSITTAQIRNELLPELTKILTLPSATESAIATRANLALELLKIIEIATKEGLVGGTPVLITPTGLTAGSVQQTFITNGQNVTVMRL